MRLYEWCSRFLQTENVGELPWATKLIPEQTDCQRCGVSYGTKSWALWQQKPAQNDQRRYNSAHISLEGPPVHPDES